MRLSFYQGCFESTFWAAAPIKWGDFLYVPPLPEAQPARQTSGMAGWASGLAGWTDGRTYIQKISPLYRTWSPIGAAAMPPPMKTMKKVEQGKGTADHLMPLGYIL